MRGVILGLGQVGRALVEQWLARPDLPPLIALADSSGLAVAPEGLSRAALRAILEVKARGGRLADLPWGTPGTLEDLLPWIDGTTLIADVTPAPTAPFLQEALGKGARVATANKLPLADGPVETFRALVGSGRLRYEATVGAGLPVLLTLELLRETGDRVRAIRGCVSGTLSFLADRLGAGVPLSEAVAEAIRLGYTEPDPRQDLEGWDAARKGGILARTLGWPADLEGIERESLLPGGDWPPDPQDLVEALRARADGAWRERVEGWAAEGRRPRYVVEVSPDGVRCRWEGVGPEDPLYDLRGPEAAVAFTTDRYADVPLTVRGPGAGAARTASAVLYDLLRLAASIP